MASVVNNPVASDAPLISVIVPCHNAAKTLVSTIGSIQAQIYQNLEIICIDDTSTDSTAQILTELSQADGRIKVVYNNANIGAGRSRNRGISVASGNYIAFVDADDHIEVDYLSTLLKVLRRENADIVQCRLRYIFANKASEHGSPPGVVVGEHCHYRIDVFDGLAYCTPHPCNKLYKRSLFDGIEYKNIHYEDTEFIPHIMRRCQRFVSIEDALYNYNKRYSTTTGTRASDLNKFDEYARSLPISVAPYLSDELAQLLLKWKAPLPGTVYGNISNFFRSLDAAAGSYTPEEKANLSRKIAELNRVMTDAMPKVVAAQFNDVVFKPKNLKSRTERIRDHCLDIVRFVHSRVLQFLEAQLFGRLDKLVLKDPNVWTFASWGHYEQHTMDNPRGLFEAVKADPSIKKVVLMNGRFQKTEVAAEGVNVTFARLQSFRGLYWMLRASKVVVGYSTHALFGYRRLTTFNKRQVIQLWHGIPIKNVGLRAIKSESWWRKEALRYAFVPSTSDADHEVMTASFAANRAGIVHVTGLPRHDLMVIPDQDLPSDYQTHLKSIRERLAGRKMVLFGPTWRTGDETPCMFTLKEFEALDELFARYNSVLSCRLHRNMMKAPRGETFISENVIYLNDIPDINILFRECAAVITDYSSLYLDFMKLDRPVFLYTSDLYRYAENRGFNYTAEEFTPHDFEITNFDALLARLELFLQGKHTLDAKYREVKSRFHAHELDGSSAQRVLKIIRN